jgi:fumarate hydratase class I
MRRTPGLTFLHRLISMLKKGDLLRIPVLNKRRGFCQQNILISKDEILIERKNLLKNSLKKRFRILERLPAPPYHLALVIGGTFSRSQPCSSEKSNLQNITTIFRQKEMRPDRHSETLNGKQKFRKICQESAIGAQFGGKYLTHDVRVIRLPRPRGHLALLEWEFSCSRRQKYQRNKLQKKGSSWSN